MATLDITHLEPVEMTPDDILAALQEDALPSYVHVDKVDYTEDGPLLPAKTRDLSGTVFVMNEEQITASAEAGTLPPNVEIYGHCFFNGLDARGTNFIIPYDCEFYAEGLQAGGILSKQEALDRKYGRRSPNFDLVDSAITGDIALANRKDSSISIKNSSVQGEITVDRVYGLFLEECRDVKRVRVSGIDGPISIEGNEDLETAAVAGECSGDVEISSNLRLRNLNIDQPLTELQSLHVHGNPALQNGDCTFIQGEIASMTVKGDEAAAGWVHRDLAKVDPETGEEISFYTGYGATGSHAYVQEKIAEYSAATQTHDQVLQARLERLDQARTEARARALAEIEAQFEDAGGKLAAEAEDNDAQSAALGGFLKELETIFTSVAVTTPPVGKSVPGSNKP